MECRFYLHLERILNFNTTRLLYMKNISILFVFLIMAGCSDFPTANNSASFVGVHAVLNPALSRQVVYVSRAFNLDVYEEYVPDTLKIRESGAIVIIHNDSQLVRFTETVPGYYQDTAGVLKVIPGKTYSIDIVTSQGEKISASTTVPLNPTLTAPAQMDTLRVDIAIDSMYENTIYVNMKFLNAPLLFQWSNPSSIQMFYFRVGSDTTYIFDHKNGYSTNYNYSLILSQGYLYQPKLQVFGRPNTYYSDSWVWAGFLRNEENIIEGASFIQIYSFDFSVTNDSRRKIMSNINGGFGYFSSMNIFRKPIYFVVTTHIVS